jgi:hypothetical protein
MVSFDSQRIIEGVKGRNAAVSSAHEIKSNTANMCSSTGPKTAGGKARSARNARRHGLSIPVLSYPKFSEEVEALAREIAGPDASLEIQELARRIAEAQIDLRRVRYARHNLLSSAIDDPDYDSPRAIRTKSKMAQILAKCMASALPEPAQIFIPFEAHMMKYVQSKPEGPQKFATILSDMAQRLSAMDRYERRALSRRKFAIRAFDLARRRAGAAVGPNPGQYQSDQPS